MPVYWLQQTESDVPLDDHWLAPLEMARASRMRFAKRRNDFRLGRWTAKCAVAEYLRCALDQIEIRAKLSGAPEVAGASISISHRNRNALCAIAPATVAVGCDLELIEPRTAAFVDDYFTIAEQREIANSTDPDLVANLLWSAKESALKATGQGLAADTRSIEVQLSGEGVLGWSRLRAGPFHGWWNRSGLLIRTIVSDQAGCGGDHPPIELGQMSAIPGSYRAIRNSCGSAR
jgi:4'-phosphopantetheinyl transferase